MAKNGIEFTLKDNSGAFLSALDDAKKRGLKAIGITAESYAKQELSRLKMHGNGQMEDNVVTGLLRNSVTYALGGEQTAILNYKADIGDKKGSYSGNAPVGDAVYIGSNVEYAPAIEFGTRKSRAYPYLKPAATEHGEEYKELMKQALKS